MERNAVQGITLAVLLINMVIIAHSVIPVTADPDVMATIDIDPDTLNLKSKSEWITCYIELPGLFEVRQIYISTIRLNGTIQAAPHFELGDYDDDTVPDLMVKFNRTEVTNCILENCEMIDKFSIVTLEVTGEVGTLPYFLILTFEGTDTIKVLSD